MLSKQFNEQLYELQWDSLTHNLRRHAEWQSYPAALKPCVADVIERFENQAKPKTHNEFFVRLMQSSGADGIIRAITGLHRRGQSVENLLPLAKHLADLELPRTGQQSHRLQLEIMKIEWGNRPSR